MRYLCVPGRGTKLAAMAMSVIVVWLIATAFQGSAFADSSAYFCPADGGTISLGANAGCTNSYYNALTQVNYYHQSGANVNHCAVSKATSDPGGASSNVIPAVCGLGAAPYGYIHTQYVSGGAYSYARGKNNENAVHYDFYGIRYWVTGSFAKSGRESTVAAAHGPAAQPLAVAAGGWARFADEFSIFNDSAKLSLPKESVVTDDGIVRSNARELAPPSAAAMRGTGAASARSRLWVAAREDGTQCLLAQAANFDGPAETCASADEAKAGTLFMTQSWSASDVELFGLVPDGVASVTVTFADGSASKLPVSGNAYAGRFSKPTASITFTNAVGETFEHNAGVDV